MRDRNEATRSKTNLKLIRPRTNREQVAARRYRTHLLGGRNLSQYDEIWLANVDGMLDQLGNFADRPLPCKLWHDRARYYDMFVFLADRFLANGDSVLDAETIHAAWKMLASDRRAMNFESLVAILKVRYHMHWNGELPQFDELRQHLIDVRATFVAMYNAARTLPAGTRRRSLCEDRFNLSPIDIATMQAAAAPAHAKRTATAHDRWANYVRFLFEPGHVYRCSKLNPTLFFWSLVLSLKVCIYPPNSPPTPPVKTHTTSLLLNPPLYYGGV